MRNAVTHKHLQARAAHTYQVDALGAGVFGGLDQGRFIHGFDDGFKQVRLMAVNDDVDLVFFQYAHVDFDRHR